MEILLTLWFVNLKKSSSVFICSLALLWQSAKPHVYGMFFWVRGEDSTFIKHLPKHAFEFFLFISFQICMCWEMSVLCMKMDYWQLVFWPVLSSTLFKSFLPLCAAFPKRFYFEGTLNFLLYFSPSLSYLSFFFFSKQ